MLTLSKRSLAAVFFLAASVCMADRAHAGLVAVASYDIDNARPSGFGLWSNTYSGTITPNGNGTVQYSGGSGTLNDGILPTSTGNSQLYALADNSVTHLHLAGGLSTIGTINLFGFANGNTIPGDIDTVRVTINGLSATFTAGGFGDANPSTGLPANQTIDLSGSALAGLATNLVDIRVLSLKGTGGNTGLYQIGEVQVFTSAVPEPSSLALCGVAGVVGLGMARKRRRRDLA